MENQSTATPPKIRLNRQQLRRMVAESKKKTNLRSNKQYVTEAQRTASRNKRKVQKQARQKNR